MKGQKRFSGESIDYYCRVCGMGSEDSAEVTLYDQLKGESLSPAAKITRSVFLIR